MKVKQKNIIEDGAAILVASYWDGTLSTGVSINRIHNIFFTESFKSPVIIKQSIGRGLRKHSSKDGVVIYDIVDDLSYMGNDNRLMLHSNQRIELYKEEKFPYKIKNIKL